MKRFVVCAMCLLGALLGACTQSVQANLPANLQGTYDLTLVNDLLFVTSTDRNELRVLRLTVDTTTRGFVRAPDPLEPLSIPVLTHPQALARDSHYDGDGNEQPGTYVYARSSGSSLLSVVAAADSQLREVVRLDTRALTASPTPGPVTAFAALASDDAGGPSTLYFATQEATGARLWRVLLPTDFQALADAQASLTAEPLLSLGADEAVSSLLVLPDRNTLGVSTRRGQVGHPGESFLLDLTTRARRTLDFGGAQVLQLATHGQVPSDDSDPRPERRAKGARIFGALDSSNCTQPTTPAPVVSCPSGILAVDAATGTLAQDDTGYTMLPINAGVGLPMGLTLSTSSQLSVQGGETRDVTVPLLGIVPLSTGAILFFDALNMSHFNVGAVWADGVTPNTITTVITLVDAANNNVDPNVPDRSADVSFTGTFGATPDSTYWLISQGVLPGASQVARDVASSTFVVSVTDSVEEGGTLPSVRPGDILVLRPEDASLPVCPIELSVAQVRRDSPTSPTATLVPAEPIPPDCADYPRFDVRAAGERPLVLVDANTGTYLRRMGTGSTYARSGAYFFHPPGYAGQSSALSASLTLTRDLGQSPVARDQHYVVSVSSHFAPFVVRIDLVNYSGTFSAFRLPGPLVRARVGDTDYAYIIYPSANGVLQMNLTTVVAQSPNALGLVPFR